jgi:hypothetical protein
MHTMRHGPLVLVRLVRLGAQAALRALGGVLVLERLPDLEVDLVAVHDVLGHGEDVRDQAVEQIHRHGLADDNTQDFGAIFFGWEGVVYLGGDMVSCLICVIAACNLSGYNLLGIMYCFARSKFEMLTCLTCGYFCLKSSVRVKATTGKPAL